MLTSSATNSSYSSSISSSEPHLPYQHPQPSSTLSFTSQIPRKPMPTKYPRFYSTPLDESLQTPLQLYGYEQREPSIIEKPRLRHQISHALVDIKEDISLQIPRETANKIKRRSTLLLDGSLGLPPRPETSAGLSRSRPMSFISMEGWSAPPRRLSRRLSRQFSRFSSSPRKPDADANAGSCISSPNLIGSSTQYGGDRSRGYI